MGELHSWNLFSWIKIVTVIHEYWECTQKRGKIVELCLPTPDNKDFVVILFCVHLFLEKNLLFYYESLVNCALQ